MTPKSHKNGPKSPFYIASLPSAGVSAWPRKPSELDCSLMCIATLTALIIARGAFATATDAVRFEQQLGRVALDSRVVARARLDRLVAHICAHERPNHTLPH